MKRNKSVYLTKWEKQIITGIIKSHLENVKTNPYFEFMLTKNGNIDKSEPQVYL